MSSTDVQSAEDPFREVHEFLRLLKDMTPSEKEAASPAIQSRVDAVATHYRKRITIPTLKHLEDFIALRKILETHGIESQSLSGLISNVIEGLQTTKTSLFPLKHIIIFGIMGGEKGAFKSQDLLFLRFDSEYDEYHVINCYGRQHFHDMLLDPRRMGRVRFAGNQLVIFRNGSSIYARVSMDGPGDVEALVAHLRTRVRGPFEEVTQDHMAKMTHEYLSFRIP